MCAIGAERHDKGGTLFHIIRQFHLGVNSDMDTYAD